ncbi:hypothetical protein [Glycomyces tritici]|uniref:Uncharacterized protein n=1 Tax=Glycomyces tritici TaxID=2665176 RepID=A0ABT7YRU3_9ACTN|nr:hypothetical protein [Glycomyces tritici]MDN3241320.1 hypothetical protein [Glycomyces tritici]MDN3243343.1 hypothetical protein [Glycomyces tritici]
MPGLTITAIVLMWVMVALAVVGGFLAVVPLLLLQDVSSSALLGPLGEWAVWLLAFGALQGLVWAGLRAYFAVGIARRSARARRGAIWAESIALVFQVAYLAVSVAAFSSAPRESGYSYNFTFDCTGLVLPILVICFLSASRSLWWCDR